MGPACEGFKVRPVALVVTPDAVIAIPAVSRATRKNPETKGFRRIRWARLIEETKGGRHAWNRELFSLRNRSGVYALRDHRTKTVLYVGESHTGRLYRTLLHHFHDPRGKFARRGEWTHEVPGKLDVAYWLCSPSEAPSLERAAIDALRPAVNEFGVEPIPF